MGPGEKRNLECRNGLMEMAQYSEEGEGDPMKGESKILHSKYVRSRLKLWMIEVGLKERRNISEGQ